MASSGSARRDSPANVDPESFMTTMVQTPTGRLSMSCPPATPTEHAAARSSSQPPEKTPDCTETRFHNSRPFPTLEPDPYSAPEHARIDDSCAGIDVQAQHEQGGASTSKQDTRHRPLLDRVQLPHPNLVLLNSGSVARDHLASERTFLAYVRTSLTLVTMGVALVQLLLMSGSSSTSSSGRTGLSPRIRASVPALGGVIIALGMSILFFGIARYFTIQTSLTEGRFPAARLGIVIVTFVLAALVAVVFGFLISGST